MQKTPRQNKSKDEIAANMAHTQKIERTKVLVRLMFPFIEEQKSIYDAQTVCAAAAGYIKQELNLKTTNIIVKDLLIDLSNDKGDKVLKDAVENLINLFQTEKADDAIQVLDRVARGLGEFSSAAYMKNPMKVIKIDEFIA